MYRNPKTNNQPIRQILTWHTFAMLNGYVREIPTFNQYLHYRLWSFAHGYTPYGGENPYEYEAYIKTVEQLRSEQVTIDFLVDS